jgi:type I restriction enzyme S subunit
MSPGYIYAWLSSDYGQRLVKRYSYGSVILEIDKEMLESVPIPIPSADIRGKIGDLVLRANELRDQAWRIERDAIQELESLIEGGTRRPVRPV